MQQEAAIEAAKAEGKPVPKFEPLVPKKPIVQSLAPEFELSLEQQQLLKTRLEKVDEIDRPAEEQAFRAELRAKAELTGRIRGIWDQQAEERKARQEAGQATTWDRVMNVVRGDNEKR